MYIRQTQIGNKATGEKYITYRLVRGERIDGKVRQVTVLNLGRNFAIRQKDWPLLCSRIEQLLASQQADTLQQTELFSTPRSDAIETAAQRYVGSLVARAPRSSEDSDATKDASDAVTQESDASSAATNASAHGSDFQEVNVDSLQLSQPRSVGVEHVSLHAVKQLNFVEKLTELGINGVMRASILGNIIGRIAHPASELATWEWLCNQSALGELLDVDFTGMSHMRLYRASDLLMKHRKAIEAHMFNAVQSLFNLEDTVTLFDLTNTYFEGAATDNPKAQRGRSKEKRSDCPLVTLGLVLDGSGFVRRSRTFAGNVFEGTTLKDMLDGLCAPSGALVIMDAGIATQANLAWLVEQGYRYLVVKRGGVRQFDASSAITIETAKKEPILLQKEISEDGKEVLLHCHSTGREEKEKAMNDKSSKAFEAGLQKIVDGLLKQHTEKRKDKLLERIGRLKEKSRGAGQHYKVDLTSDDSGKVTALTWSKEPVRGTIATHPGVYCLRSNELSWTEEQMWRTYTMLTDLESVFRSLKSELGLRPVFHAKEDRSDGHLFITVLAYQFVQVLRKQLKEAGINDSWNSLRNVLSVQRRVTTRLHRKDGHTIHIRKSTIAEPALMKIYRALKINSTPGKTSKLIC